MLWSGDLTTPVIVIDGAVIVGLDSAEIDEYGLTRTPSMSKLDNNAFH
jgi:hypothetical protein